MFFYPPSSGYAYRTPQCHTVTWLRTSGRPVFLCIRRFDHCNSNHFNSNHCNSNLCNANNYTLKIINFKIINSTTYHKYLHIIESNILSNLVRNQHNQTSLSNFSLFFLFNLFWFQTIFFHMCITLSLPILFLYYFLKFIYSYDWNKSVIALFSVFQGKK